MAHVKPEFNQADYDSLRAHYFNPDIRRNVELAGGRILRRQTKPPRIEQDSPGFRQLRGTIKGLEKAKGHKGIYALLRELRDWETRPPSLGGALPSFLRRVAADEVTETIDLTAEENVIDVDTYIIDHLLTGVLVPKPDPDGGTRMASAAAPTPFVAPVKDEPVDAAPTKRDGDICTWCGDTMPGTADEAYVHVCAACAANPDADVDMLHAPSMPQSCPIHLDAGDKRANCSCCHFEVVRQRQPASVAAARAESTESPAKRVRAGSDAGDGASSDGSATADYDDYAAAREEEEDPEEFKRIVSAAFRGDTATIEEWFSTGTRNPDEQEGSGWTLLGLATSNYNCATMRFLLARGANVNKICDYHGYTPLHVAITTGRRDAAVLLLDHGADIDARAVENLEYECEYTERNICGNYVERTPLMLAVALGNCTIVRLLLQRGADISRWNHELDWKSEQKIVSELLIEFGGKLFWPKKEKPEAAITLIVDVRAAGGWEPFARQERNQAGK